MKILQFSCSVSVFLMPLPDLRGLNMKLFKAALNDVYEHKHEYKHARNWPCKLSDP